MDMYIVHIHLFIMHTLYASNILKASSNFTVFWNFKKIIIELIHKPLAYLNNAFLNKKFKHFKTKFEHNKMSY